MENLRPQPSTGAHASEKVGASPELLCQIFTHANDRDLAVCSEISKTWQSAAISVRWRVVLDPVSLFSILAPMVPCGPSYERYTFSQPIGPSDWKRFEKYGRCVRVLWHGRLSPWDEHRGLHTSAFAAIASTRTALNFLPLLATFRWGDDANLAFLPMFLHPNITRFQLIFNSFHDTRFANGLHAMAVRMPHLTELTIELMEGGRSADVTTLGEPTLFELLSAYPNLRKLAIPPSHASERVLKTICSLDNLVSLRIGNRYIHSEGCHSISSPSSVTNEGDQGNSTLLHLECIVAHFTILSEYLESFSHFHSLTTLTATTPITESHRTLKKIFRLIGERCPSLVDISITPDIAPPLDEMRFTANSSEHRITFKTLRPLAALHLLESFEFRFDYPIWITDDEFEELISNFPKLCRLFFNPGPKSDLDNPPLTLGAVRSLIKHCPEIEGFELFLDATAPIPPDPEFDDSTENLDSLDGKRICVGFGISNIRDPVETTMALSSMVSTLTPYIGPTPTMEDPEAVRRLNAWEQVYRDLRIYQNIRKAERNRVLGWMHKMRTESRASESETVLDP